MLVEFSAYPKKVRNRAQRRISYIRGESAEKILRHDRYWSVPFLALLIDTCRKLALVDPERAHAIARQGPALTELLRTGPGIENFGSAPEARSWRVVALTNWAEAARAYGDFEESAGVLKQAVELAARGRVDVRALTYLEHSRAALGYELAEPTASARSQKALDLGRRGGPASVLAETLLLRAVAKTAEGRAVGMEEAAEAVVRTPPKGERGIRLFDYSLALLRRFMNLPISTADDHRAAAGQLNSARRAHYAQTVKSPRKLDLLRTEAMLLGRLGITRMAIRRLERIGLALEEIETLEPVAECTLELAIFYLDEDSPARAKAVLDEGVERLHRLRGSDFDLEVLARAVANPTRDGLDRERLRWLAAQPRATVPTVLVPGRLDRRLAELEQDWGVGEPPGPESPTTAG